MYEGDNYIILIIGYISVIILLLIDVILFAEVILLSVVNLVTSTAAVSDLSLYALPSDNNSHTRPLCCIIGLRGILSASISVIVNAYADVILSGIIDDKSMVYTL